MQQRKWPGSFREEWESSVDCIDVPMTSTWVSSSLLRPFLFFVTFSSTLHNKLQITDTKCMLTCFKILLQSINSTEPKENFCSLAIGTFQEKNTWLYQARKLVSVCSSILVECDYFSSEGEDPALLTALSMRLIVSLTDLNVWKSFENENIRDASIAIKNLIRFVVTGKSGLYGCIRRYIMKLDAPIAARSKSHVQTDDCFLVTASAVTLALRPFQVSKLESDNVGLSVDFSGDEDNCLLDVKDAVEQYCIYLLTVPWLTERLPPVLLPALKHVSILSPCLKTLLISKEKIFIEMSNLDQSMTLGDHLEAVPSASWALANIISLATEFDNDCGDSRRFVDGLDCRLYIHAVNCISKNLMPWVDKVGQKLEVNDEELGGDHTSLVDLLKPVHQQWHLMRLLDFINESSFKEENVSLGKLELLDFVFFYSYMLRIFSSLNHIYGSLPILNTLSFTPAVLLKLWESLETSIFCENGYVTEADRKLFMGGCHGDEVLDKKERRFTKDSSNKWVSVLHKITGKSPMDVDSNPHLSSGLVDLARPDKDPSDLWDVKTLSRGPQGISNNISYLLHLFCATYAHLLTILDDIEFYEKQVPFTLERQRIIAAVLNTLVYNGFFHKNVHNNKPLMDAAVRCLHLLYERDCRHRFCPSSLWLAPARNSRPPIAVAARAHEAVSSNMRSGDALTITTIPHVFPFEERVQMFREFIKLDKVSRRIAGEVAGPGPGLVEIVVRRDHIVEDGFRQLNSLGSRLKSCINVSFVSECGLPEAGLDYGGLSKEFLTDISRKAFDPEYGLFSQTSTSERHLIPNTAARMVENGIQMIEFLGRVVGKALYEGILLDYSFSLVFIQKLLGRYSFLDELSTLDPELYRNLMYVKHYDGDVKELSLDFTVTEEILNKRVVTELKPGGSNVVVTNENKLQYVHAIADFKLNRLILPLANAFYRGLIDLISPSWLTLFNASEFNQLLSGGEHDFDVDDLRSNTRYTGGYSQGSRTIKLFWEVIAGFEPKERCLLLKFVTSCSRAPLLGFKHLQPTFTIHKVACDVPLWAMIGGQDVERLPSASTCYNTLKLPTYKRPSTMRNKLLYAVSSNAGFELS